MVANPASLVSRVVGATPRSVPFRGVKPGAGKMPSAAPPKINMPSPSIARTTPPSVSMPKPSIGNPVGRSAPSRSPAMNAVASTGDPSMNGWGAMASIAGGAGIGAAASWASGGSMMQGAAFGAMAGAGTHAGLKYRNDLASFGESGMSHFGGAKAAAYSGKMTQFADQFTTQQSRRAMVGAGAALGGFVFGGDRSHKRGFNQNRGNSIGR